MNIIRVGYLSGGNTLMVNVESGAVVSATNGTKTVTGVSVDGLCKLRVQAGTWRVWAELDGQQTSEVEVIVTDNYYKEMSFCLPLSSLAEGTLIKLNENGNGVNFYLAKHDYESGLNGTGRSLLVRKDCYDTRVWHSSNANAYASSAIDAFLNGTYKNLLDASVQELAATTKFYYTVGNGSATLTTLERSVFLLSATELGKTASYINTEGSALPIASTLEIASHNGSAVIQWTRTPHKGGHNPACALNTDGSLNYYYCTKTYGSRPIFTLPATAMVNPEPNADGSYTLLV